MKLRLGISGDLNLELNPDGRGAKFSDASGRDTLAYRNLDAKGKHLPVTVARAEQGLAIRVGTKNAAWPIVVDPLIYNIRQKFTVQTGKDDDAEYLARFGYSSAMSAKGNGHRSSLRDGRKAGKIAAAS